MLYGNRRGEVVMKVGDLVQVKLGTGVYEHRNLFDEVGIVLDVGWSDVVVTVYILGKSTVFFLDHLEVVNESR